MNITFVMLFMEQGSCFEVDKWKSYKIDFRKRCYF